MLAEFSIIPIGKEESLSSYVAKAIEIVHQSGLEYRINPMGTIIEGDWDVIMDLIKKCHETIKKESNRVITTITIDDRTVSGPRMDRKIRSVEEKTGHPLKK
jgi:uncharacterized protein (TIGR00106 family)